jgi:hypothetical protein
VSVRAEITLEAAQVLQTGASDRIVTAEATLAHQRVIRTGLQHVDGLDSCTTQGIRQSAADQCPHYQEADLAYTALFRLGQKGKAH